MNTTYNRNKSGANKTNESEKAFEKTKEYVWRKNKDYVGGASVDPPIDCTAAHRGPCHEEM